MNCPKCGEDWSDVAAVRNAKREARTDTAALVADRLRAEFLRFLTVDGPTEDRRRRNFNQAIFDAKDGYAIFSGTDLDMVMAKFDKALRAALEATDGR
jgi:hypothetical protein